jgi:hypothetical protein
MIKIRDYNKEQKIMQTKILKVVSQTEPVYVASKKQEGGQLAKCYIRLKELGGDYEDEYQCALLGNIALCKYAVGKTVIATLRFSTHENNGVYYQDIVASDIVTIN